jgi:hypothetical protein
MMRMATRTNTLGGALTICLLVGLAREARAAGGRLPVSSTACTDQLRSTTGVYTTGFASNDARVATWTVSVSTTQAGPESTILQVVQREPPKLVVPSPGPLYYRTCLTNTSTSTAYYRLHISPNAPIAEADAGLGAHLASLAPGGVACGEFAVGQARLVAQSDVAIR